MSSHESALDHGMNSLQPDNYLVVMTSSFELYLPLLSLALNARKSNREGIVQAHSSRAEGLLK